MKKPVLFAISAVDQGLLSAFNLGITILFMAQLPARDFGVFALIMSVAMAAMAVQNALVCSQLTVLRAKTKSDGEDTRLITTLWSVNVVVTVVSALLILPVLWFYDTQERGALLYVATLFVAVTLFREYVRVYFFSDLQIASVTVCDAIYLAVGVGGLAFLHIQSGSIDLSSGLLVLSVAGALSFVFGALLRPGHFRVRTDRFARRDYREIWRAHASWALSGAVAGQVQMRGHVFLVAGAFGPAAAGLLHAGQMAFRPVFFMMTAWQKIAMPLFAKYTWRGDPRAADRLAHASAALLFLLNALYTGAIYLAWPYLEAHVLSDEYDAVGGTLLLWGLHQGVVLVKTVYVGQLQGRAAFRQLGILGIAAAALTLVAQIGVIVSGGRFIYAIPVAIFGELFVLIAALYVLRSPVALARPSDRDGS